jgi:putative ABC transport system substrate-binding protein
MRPARIGWLVVGLSGQPGPLMRAFSEGLRDLGYAEGRDVAIEYRFAEGKEERLPALAAELLDLPVDVIVAGSPQAAAAAKAATDAKPIVAVVPASLNRPGGNVTGLSHLSGPIMGKQLELLKATVPGLARVALLVDPGQGRSAADAILGKLRESAEALRLEILPLPVPDGASLEPALAAARREGAQAVLAFGGELFITERARFAELANRARLPSMHGRRENVEAGGLMSHAANAAALWRRAATYVDKILKGTSPAELPVEQPTRFDFVLNLKTAQALGLTIPESVLAQATELIQ